MEHKIVNQITAVGLNVSTNGGGLFSNGSAGRFHYSNLNNMPSSNSYNSNRHYQTDGRSQEEHSLIHSSSSLFDYYSSQSESPIRDPHGHFRHFTSILQRLGFHPGFQSNNNYTAIEAMRCAPAYEQCPICDLPGCFFCVQTDRAKETHHNRLILLVYFSCIVQPPGGGDGGGGPRVGRQKIINNTWWKIIIMVILVFVALTTLCCVRNKLSKCFRVLTDRISDSSIARRASNWSISSASRFRNRMKSSSLIPPGGGSHQSKSSHSNGRTDYRHSLAATTARNMAVKSTTTENLLTPGGDEQNRLIGGNHNFGRNNDESYGVQPSSRFRSLSNVEIHIRSPTIDDNEEDNEDNKTTSDNNNSYSKENETEAGVDQNVPQQQQQQPPEQQLDLGKGGSTTAAKKPPASSADNNHQPTTVTTKNNNSNETDTDEIGFRRDSGIQSQSEPELPPKTQSQSQAQAQANRLVDPSTEPGRSGPEAINGGVNRISPPTIDLEDIADFDDGPMSAMTLNISDLPPLESGRDSFILNLYASNNKKKNK